MKNQQALSNLGVLLIVAIVGGVLFFVAPRFLSHKGGGRQAEKNHAAATSTNDASLANYSKAYQIGTGKAKAAQAAAAERNGGD